MKNNLFSLVSKSLLVAIGIGIGITLSNSIAEEPKLPVETSQECVDADQFQEFLRATKEEMVFAGLHAIPKKNSSEFTVMVITMNRDTGDWSQFEMMENSTVCYITGGAAGRTLTAKKVGFSS